MTAGTEPRSEHVAVSRMALPGGQSYEVITASRTFLIAALEDARSWCHVVGVLPDEVRGAKLDDYDAALAVVEACVADSPAQLLP